MQRTVFDTPVLNTVLRAFSRACLHLSGWTLEGRLPPEARKSVLIAAPHTSNWDFPYTLMVAFGLRLNIHWMGKASLFRWPFGPLMRWLGGIAVDRARSGNLVAASAAAILAADGPLQLVVAPEGTRRPSKSGLAALPEPPGGRDGRSPDPGAFETRPWKTGFYFIALQARVPIVLAFMDYQRKVSGLGPVFTPTGDVDKDMAAIKLFYAPFTGRRVGQFEAP